MLSVVIPACNEEEMLPKCAKEVSETLTEAGIEYEIIYVDDGSKDDTWQCIIEAGKSNPCIRGISFSRNFGKESAIFAGLREAKGDCVAVMDCDLQHPVKKLISMYRKWEEGYEIIEGVKRSRGEESPFYGFAAGTFYKLMSKACGTDLSGASDFKLLDRKAVNVILNIPEKGAFFRALSSWVGFKTTEVKYDVAKREAGTTKWSSKGLTSYALTNITSFTTIPMQFILWCGLVTFLVGLVFSVIALCQKISGAALEGFTTVIILLCFIGSIIMIALGIIGYYIAKIYDEVKGRPRYIVAERTDGGSGDEEQ